MNSNEVDSPPPEDIIRILIATDNHVGFAEKDHIRRDDSFEAFDEILSIACREKVDMVLLGGDLFHENKPSRSTLYRVMEILRKHCLNDNPVAIQIVSDQNKNFGGFERKFNRVNYEDPHFNVGLPVFSIHGNHDDPTREGHRQALAALDLLHVANFVNYIGKHDSLEQIDVIPVLMQKGETKLALYGLGSIRDQRLYHMFHRQHVVFHEPEEDTQEWFNLFVLHQNRDNRGRGPKNAVPEAVLPDFLDLVIWGHEHECLINPVPSSSDKYHICQPGSSVRTALSDGEAKAKHVGILEVYKCNYKLTPVPLRCVRPFRMTEVILAEVGIDRDDPAVHEHVEKVLGEKVEQMLLEIEHVIAKLPESSRPPKNMQLPLIRIRVEHSGFNTLNNQRFGSRFVARVANPSDMLLWYRKRVPTQKQRTTKSALSEAFDPAPHPNLSIHDLLQQEFTTQKTQLRLLSESSLNEAVEDYVQRNEPSAIRDCVGGLLEQVQKQLEKASDVGTRDAIKQYLETITLPSHSASVQRSTSSSELTAQSDTTPFSAGRKRSIVSHTRDADIEQRTEEQQQEDSNDTNDDTMDTSHSNTASRGGSTRGRKRKATNVTKRRRVARTSRGQQSLNSMLSQVQDDTSNVSDI